MCPDYPLSDLKDNIEEIEQHQRAAPQRIRAFYFDDEEPPEGFSEFEREPHQLMLENAAKWAVMPRSVFGNVRIVGKGPPATEFEYLALGVATERLLNAIYLYKNPKYFTNHLEDNSGKTPEYEKAEGILLSDLSSKLNDEQMKRVTLVLEIMRKQRNNIAHFGFHRFSFSKHFALIYQVLAFLFDRYSTELTDEVAKMREYYEETSRIEETYGHVELPFDEGRS
jgi:hypothetical protein